MKEMMFQGKRHRTTRVSDSNKGSALKIYAACWIEIPPNAPMSLFCLLWEKWSHFLGAHPTGRSPPLQSWAGPLSRPGHRSPALSRAPAPRAQLQVGWGSSPSTLRERPAPSRAPVCAVSCPPKSWLHLPQDISGESEAQWRPDCSKLLSRTWGNPSRAEGTFLFANFLAVSSKRRVNSTLQLTFRRMGGTQWRPWAGVETPHALPVSKFYLLYLQDCGRFAIDFYAHGSMTFISFCNTKHLFCSRVMSYSK